MRKPQKCKYCKKLIPGKELKLHQRQCRFNSIKKERDKFKFQPKDDNIFDRILNLPNPHEQLKEEGKIIAELFTLGVIGPPQKIIDIFPRDKKTRNMIEAINNRIIVDYPAIIFQNRDNPPTKGLVVIPVRDSFGDTGSRVIVHGNIELPTIEKMVNIGQAIYELINRQELQNPRINTNHFLAEIDRIAEMVFTRDYQIKTESRTNENQLNVTSLDKFDQTISNCKDSYDREFHFKLLYRYFWLYSKLLAELCEIKLSDKGSFSKSWKEIRTELNTVIKESDIEKWNTLFKKLIKIRNNYEHNDNFEEPEIEKLKEWRLQAGGYPDWIKRVTSKYIHSIPSVKLVDSLSDLIKGYIFKTKTILQKYGDKTPELLDGFMEDYGALQYLDINPLITKLETEYTKSLKVTDLSVDFFRNAMRLIEFIGIFKARENFFLELNICPKCGDRIERTEQQGTDIELGTELDYIRCGCRECNYVVYEGHFESFKEQV